MIDDHEHPPSPLDYRRYAGPIQLAVGVYLFALLWAAVTMRFYTAATVVYGDENFAEFRAQVALLACAALRLGWARRRRERGEAGYLHPAAAPGSVIWAVASPLIAWLGRKLGAGH